MKRLEARVCALALAGCAFACSSAIRAPSFPAETLTRSLGVASPAPPVPPGSGGNISNAARVVAGMRAGFRACYADALRRHGAFSASVRLTMLVATDGSIWRVTGRGTNAPRDLIECFFIEVARHRFEPPEGGAAVVNVPVNLMQT